jgi:hypothetical protein
VPLGFRMDDQTQSAGKKFHLHWTSLHGRNFPCTAEILTPPFSITFPFSITRVLPPPGRSQRSSLNLVDLQLLLSLQHLVLKVLYVLVKFIFHLYQ